MGNSVFATFLEPANAEASKNLMLHFICVEFVGMMFRPQFF